MNDSRNSNLGDWFRSLIQSLKGIKEGFNSTTGVYGGGGIDEVNNKLEAVKTKLDTLDVSVKLDDADIHNIYTLLDDRLVKKLWITRADYDALAVKDPETLYIVIESQSNPSNP